MASPTKQTWAIRERKIAKRQKARSKKTRARIKKLSAEKRVVAAVVEE